VFRLLAPFVESGDYMTMHKTFTGSRYRVLFDDEGGCRRRRGRMDFFGRVSDPLPIPATDE